MKISTVGELTKGNVLFASLVNAKPESMVLKSFTVDGRTETKTAPDGRPVYRSPLSALRVGEDGQIMGEDRSSTLSILEPSNIEAGKIYALSGLTWISHYENNGRVAVSIIAERVKLADEVPAVNLKDLAATLAGGSKK